MDNCFFQKSLFLGLLSNHYPAILYLWYNELCFLVVILRFKEIEYESLKRKGVCTRSQKFLTWATRYPTSNPSTWA